MDRSENTALVIAGALMALFFGLLIYAATSLDIDVPTCISDVPPFEKGAVIDRGDGHYEVHMVAKMWEFDPPEIRLPPGAKVDLYLSTPDVTHGLYIEHTNVNLMAVPGNVNAAQFQLDDEGEYDVICHEYCGVGHHRMMGKIIVAQGAVPVTPSSTGEAAAGGAALFEDEGCDSCHSIDGSDGLGPTMKGLLGRTVHFDDGTTRVADAVYIAESIREPDAHLVADYDPIMPPADLSDEQVEELVDYIKGLQ